MSRYTNWSCRYLLLYIREYYDVNMLSYMAVCAREVLLYLLFIGSCNVWSPPVAVIHDVVHSISSMRRVQTSIKIDKVT